MNYYEAKQKQTNQETVFIVVVLYNRHAEIRLTRCIPTEVIGFL